MSKRNKPSVAASLSCSLSLPSPLASHSISMTPQAAIGLTHVLASTPPKQGNKKRITKAPQRTPRAADKLPSPKLNSAEQPLAVNLTGKKPKRKTTTTIEALAPTQSSKVADGAKGTDPDSANPLGLVHVAATEIVSPEDHALRRDRSKSKKYNHDIDYDPSAFSKDDVARHYTALVRQTAMYQMRGLPANVDVDDLISVGYNGLMDAYDKFDPTKGIKFSTYIRFRIEGAMLDELRSQDYLPRNVRTMIKKDSATRESLERTLGRHPTDNEVAQALGLSLNQYQEASSRSAVKLLRIEDLENSGQSPRDKRRDISGLAADIKLRDPVASLSDDRLRLQVRQLSTRLLSERQRLILALSAFEGLSLKEIAKIIGVTDCRTSQLHALSVQRMSAALRSMVISERMENSDADPKSLRTTTDSENKD